MSVLVHPQLSLANKSPKLPGHGVVLTESASLDSDDFLQDNECLPTENVAVIEDLMSEEKLENLRAMVNGNVRKKLYFNPAYFEPHLLAVSKRKKDSIQCFCFYKSSPSFHLSPFSLPPLGTPASCH